MAAFESLRAAGKIRAWGVSNFKVSDMEDLFRVPEGNRCATNQVRYNLTSRSIENDLLPWCEERGMPVMAYSPLGGDSLVSDPTLIRIGAAHNCSAPAVALAWAIRSGRVIAIPEVWVGGARKGKRGGTLPNAHAARTSDTGCSVPDAISRHVAVAARSGQAMDASKFSVATAMIFGPPRAFGGDAPVLVTSTARATPAAPDTRQRENGGFAHPYFFM